MSNPKWCVGYYVGATLCNGHLALETKYMGSICRDNQVEYENTQ